LKHRPQKKTNMANRKAKANGGASKAKPKTAKK
jgi:hypothetical protein